MTLMLHEFRNSSPGDRVRLASVWGIRLGSPAAVALGLPRTDTDKSDETQQM